MRELFVMYYQLDSIIHLSTIKLKLITLPLNECNFAGLRGKIAYIDGKEELHIKPRGGSTSHHSLKEKRLRLGFNHSRSEDSASFS